MSETEDYFFKIKAVVKESFIKISNADIAYSDFKNFVRLSALNMSRVMGKREFCLCKSLQGYYNSSSC